MAMSASNIIIMSEEDERYLILTDLKRLLDRMEHYNPDHLTSYTLKGRAVMALDFLEKLKPDAYPVLDEALRERVHEACRKAEELAMKKRETEIDWVDEIFFKPNRHGNAGTNESVDDFGSDHGEFQVESLNHDTAATDRLDSSSRSIEALRREDVEEIQKAQREQLEAEISHMATHLKASTQRMNLTIRGQTEHLEEMEALATENVHRVGKAADNVQEHNRKAWSSTLATWTLMLAIFGTFIFCIMTIQMVPKRADTSLPCLVNCNPNEKSVQERALERLEQLRIQQEEVEREANRMYELVAQREAEAARVREEDANRRKIEAESRSTVDDVLLREKGSRQVEDSNEEGVYEEPGQLPGDESDHQAIEVARFHEEEAARLKAEEAARQAAEVARIQDEEAARLKAEEAARRTAEETRVRKEKAARIKAEEIARRAAEEARVHEEEATRLAVEEADRLREKEAARIQAEEARVRTEEVARLAAEEAVRLREKEAARIKAEEARVRKEEVARLAAEKAHRRAAEEARLREEEAARQAAEEAGRRAAEEARVRKEEVARLAAEDADRLAAEEGRVREEEAARLVAEEASRRAAEESCEDAATCREAEGAVGRPPDDADVSEQNVPEHETRQERKPQNGDDDNGDDDEDDLEAAKERLRKQAEAARKAVEFKRKAEERRLQLEKEQAMENEKQSHAEIMSRQEDDASQPDSAHECGIDECASSTVEECAAGCDAVVHPTDVTPLTVHRAAAGNDVDALRQALQIKPEFVTHKDDNGWEPLHEAAFRGHLEALHLLLHEYNVDVNTRTQNGATALWWARKLPKDHPVVTTLKAAGGISIGPVE